MFKDKLKELRMNKNLSQYELAEKIFVSRSTIAKWENGNGIPSDANLEALCEYFNVEEDWLLDRNDLKKIVRSNIVKVGYILFDIIVILICSWFLIVSISGTPDKYLGNGSDDEIYITLYYKVSVVGELGAISLIPLLFYIVTIALSVIDFLINFNIIRFIEETKMLKLIILLMLIICMLIYPITWYLASPFNSPIK